MGENIEVIGITKKILREAIEKNTYWKDTIAPLPKSKAQWLVDNERIAEEDYCGVIALDNEKVCAFIYMIPDLLNKNSAKVYWMIDWWVQEQYKNTVLGTYIYNQAVQLAGNQILVKAYTENVKAFYEKQDFKVIASRLRYTLFFSLDASILMARFTFLKPFRFFVKALDAITATCVRQINSFKLGQKTKALHYEYISEVDEETWSMLKPSFENDLILKTKDYINWQINNNQYIQTPIAHKTPRKTLQTGMSPNIYLHNVKILWGEKIIGFLSYTVNYNEFNVKYFIVDKESNYELCVDALLENLIKSKRNFIFTDDTALAQAINQHYFSVFTHKVLKKGLAHNAIDFNFEGLSMWNRDGHFY
tara:strand:+ start:34531 stop:35619 length:1089 start_codon:yes stop_codon:yes gene_type:complete